MNAIVICNVGIVFRICVTNSAPTNPRTSYMLHDASLCDKTKIRREGKRLCILFTANISSDDSLFSIFYTLFDRRRGQRTDLNSQCVVCSVSRMSLCVCACGSHSSRRIGNIIYSMRFLPRVFDPCCVRNKHQYRLWFSSFDILWKRWGGLYTATSPSRIVYLAFHIFSISTPGLNPLFAPIPLNFLHYFESISTINKCFRIKNRQKYSTQYAKED